jgi:hypothetical protein
MTYFNIPVLRKISKINVARYRTGRRTCRAARGQSFPFRVEFRRKRANSMDTFKRFRTATWKGSLPLPNAPLSKPGACWLAGRSHVDPGQTARTNAVQCTSLWMFVVVVREMNLFSHDRRENNWASSVCAVCRNISEQSSITSCCAIVATSKSLIVLPRSCWFRPACCALLLSFCWP